MWIKFDFSTSVMHKNLKFLHRFVSTGTACGACDKYEVWHCVPAKVIYNVDDGLSYDLYRKKREIVVSEAPSLQVFYQLTQSKISNTTIFLFFGRISCWNWIYILPLACRITCFPTSPVDMCLCNRCRSKSSLSSSSSSISLSWFISLSSFMLKLTKPAGRNGAKLTVHCTAFGYLLYRNTFQKWEDVMFSFLKTV